MSDDTLPPLTVVLLTYDRLAYARTTLESLMHRLRYPGPMFLHIADDGSSKDHVPALLRLAENDQGIDWKEITTSNAERGGYGKSYNLACQAVHPRGGMVLPLEDDWQCQHVFHVEPLVKVLAEGPFAEYGVGCIRLGYLGFTQDMAGKLFHAHGQTFMLLDQHSRERHIFAGHPRLESVEWQRFVGPWPEGLAAGKTEFEVAGRQESRQGVAWPMDLVHAYGSLFSHIGSRRAGEDIDGSDS